MDHLNNDDFILNNFNKNEEKDKNLNISNLSSNHKLPHNFISIIRLKPLSLIESKKGRKMVKIIDNKTLKVNELQFNFDHIFSENSTQETVFSTCIHQYIDLCLEGFNLNIFTIGQSASGKSYTLGTLNNKDNGIIQRSILHIFNYIKLNKENFIFQIKASLIEVINEEYRDLLNCNMLNKNITVRENSEGKIEVSGITECSVIGVEDTMNVFSCINLSKKQNEPISKPYTVFIIKILKTHKADKTNSKFQINFIDTVCPEKSKKMDKSVIGMQTLNKVFMALSDLDKKNGLYIPYKESKLTMLLKDCITNNSVTLVIGCINPSDIFLDETLNYLSYTSSVRNVKNQFKNITDYDSKKDIDKERYLEIKSSYDKEITKLRNILSIILKQKNITNITFKDLTKLDSHKFDILEYELLTLEKDEQLRMISDENKKLKDSLEKLNLMLKVPEKKEELIEFKEIEEADLKGKDYYYDDNFGISDNFNFLQDKINYIFENTENKSSNSKLEEGLNKFKYKLKEVEENYNTIKNTLIMKNELIQDLEERNKQLNMKIIEKNYVFEKNKTSLKTEIREKSPSRSPTKNKTTIFSERKNNIKTNNRKMINLNNSLSTIHPTVSDQKVSTTINNLDQIEKELINKIEREFVEYYDLVTIKTDLHSKHVLLNEKKLKTLKNLQNEKDIILYDLNKIKRVENILSKYDQDNPALKEKMVNAQAKIALIIKEKLEKLNKFSEDNLNQIKEEEVVIKNEMNSIEDRLIDIKSMIISNFSSKHFNDLQRELDEKKIQLSDLELKYQKLVTQDKENEDKIDQLRIDLIIKENLIRKLEKELKEKILEYEDKAFQMEFELCRKMKESKSSDKIKSTFYSPIKPYIETMGNIKEEGEEAVSKRKMRKNQSMGNVKVVGRIESKINSDWKDEKPMSVEKDLRIVKNSVTNKLKK